MDFYDNSSVSQMAVIQAVSDAGFGCSLQFFTKPATGAPGTATQKMQITPAGGIVVFTLPASNPGAGTKQLWYDPADGNRVKFAP
jgi:hypothetical protein